MHGDCLSKRHLSRLILKEKEYLEYRFFSVETQQQWDFERHLPHIMGFELLMGSHQIKK